MGEFPDRRIALWWDTGRMNAPDPDQQAELSSASPDQTLRLWEVVLLGFGLFVVAALALFLLLGMAIEALWPPDCGFVDMDCELAPVMTGFWLGVATAAAVTFVVVRRWRRRPPQRVVAWLVSVAVITTVTAGLVVNAVWG
jgi:hypothetical protein